MAMISAQLAMMKAIRLAEYNKTKEKEKKDMATTYYFDKDTHHSMLNNKDYSLDAYTEEVISMYCKIYNTSTSIVTEDSVWESFLEMAKYKFENEMWRWVTEYAEEVD